MKRALDTRICYINSGPPNKSSVVTRETLRYKIGNQMKSQEWQSFEDFVGRGCEILSKDSRDVGPIVLTGENATSHVTYFAPRTTDKKDRYANFHPWEKFIKDVQRNNTIELTVEAETLAGEKLRRHCNLKLTEDEVKYLAQGCAVTLPCRK